MSEPHGVVAPAAGKLAAWRSIKNCKKGDKLVSIKVCSDSDPTILCETKVYATVTGKIDRYLYAEGDEVKVGDVIATIKGCEHPGFFNSLCVSCGEKVAEQQVVTDDSNGHEYDRDRQSQMEQLREKQTLTISKGLQLQFSTKEAVKFQEKVVNNLKANRKIALVLDIDHTLLHATACHDNIPPSDVHMIHGEIHLPIEESTNNGFVIKHHVIKLRPHLHEFIVEASKIAQLSIYTAATRKYAEAVAKIIDPTSKYLSLDRIVTRSDAISSSNNGISEKSLHRLFLGDSSMAVIMDDTEHVWKGEQINQLLLVKPFKHLPFSGLQDANNAAGQLISSVPSPGGVAVQLQSQTTYLLQGERSGTIFQVTNTNEVIKPISEYDDQLPRCLDIIKNIHQLFYHHVDSNSVSHSSCNSNISNALTVSSIIADIKRSILRGCVITFSGIIQLNDQSPEKNPLWQLALSLGARVTMDVCSRTTHLITTYTTTSKVLECEQRKDIWIIRPDWLHCCRWSLSKAFEESFVLKPHPIGSPYPNPRLDDSPLPIEPTLVSGKRGRDAMHDDVIALSDKNMSSYEVGSSSSSSKKGTSTFENEYFEDDDNGNVDDDDADDGDDDDDWLDIDASVGRQDKDMDAQSMSSNDSEDLLRDIERDVYDMR